MGLQGILAPLSAPAPASTLSGRRFAIAGFIGLLLPGLGHALVGRRREALVFLVPILFLVVAVMGAYAGGGFTALAAFALTPGVLPVLAVLNVGLAIWRIASGVDAARATRKPGSRWRSSARQPCSWSWRRTCGSARTSRPRTTS